MASEEPGGKPQPEPPAAPTLEMIKASSDCWRQRPQLAVHVATIASAWTLLELELAMIFIHLIKGNRVAIAAMFQSIVSVPTRIEMLKSIATDAVDDDMQKELSTLCTRLRRVAKRRSDAIHGTWGILDRETDAIFLVDVFRPKKRVPYRARDFLQIEEQIVQLRSDLTDFRVKLNR